MKHYTFTETLKDVKNVYIRVNKKEALKHFSDGETVYFTPVNCSPCNPYYNFSIGMNRENKNGWIDLEKMTDSEYFNYLIYRYELFHCNSELGYYTAFYIITSSEKRR